MTKKRGSTPLSASDYGRLVSDISGLLEQARRTAARTVNSILTATYWEIGRRIVEYEQGGKEKSEYGEKLLERLSTDLTAKHGRGFSRSNVAQMRAFYQAWEIVQTPSGRFEARVKCPTLSNKSKAEKVQTLSAESTQVLGPAHAPLQPGVAPTDVFSLSWLDEYDEMARGARSWSVAHRVADPAAGPENEDCSPLGSVSNCLSARTIHPTRPCRFSQGWNRGAQ